MATDDSLNDILAVITEQTHSSFQQSKSANKPIKLHDKPFEEKVMPKSASILPLSKKQWFAEMTPSVEEGQISTLEIVEGKTQNALFDMFFHAYNTHGGISLRPEDIYGAYMNTVSKFINEQHELFRNKIYGKTGNLIGIDVVGEPNWIETIDEYLTNFKQEYIKAISVEFSTSTSVDKLVTKCYIMDTVKSIAPLELNTLCGIKSFELLGTSADWQKLKEKVLEVYKFLGNYHFGYYLDEIIPVLETLCGIKETQEKGKEITPKMKDFLSSALTIGYKRESGLELEFDGWLRKFITTTTEFMVQPVTHYNQILPAYVQVPVKWSRMGQQLNLTFQAGLLAVGFDPKTQTFSTIHGVRIYE